MPSVFDKARIFFTDSDELCKHMAKLSDGVVILSFSTGKDSIGAWLQLKKYFHTIIPVYMYGVPDISFVNKSLTYYENFFDTMIYRFPHPSFYRKLVNGVFQTCEQWMLIQEYDLPEFEYIDIFNMIAAKLDLPDDVYTAVGVRAVDSPTRWTAMKNYGPITHNQLKFYPIYDWRKARLMDEIRASGVKLPIDYMLFGRSFDGIDYRFIAPIKEHFPEDYARIKFWFPLIDAEILRLDWRKEYYAKQETAEAAGR